MPLPALSTVVRVVRTVFSFGRFVYELVDEARHEKAQEERELAAKRREMSQRYQEASNTAGPRSK